MAGMEGNNKNMKSHDHESNHSNNQHGSNAHHGSHDSCSCCREAADDSKACSIDEAHGGCCCGGDCEDGEMNLKSKGFLSGVFLYLVGMMADHFLQQLPQFAVAGFFLAAYLLIGKDVLLTAGRNILKGEIFDENFLMAIASLGAFAIGEYPEAVAVMIFYQLGEYMQGRAVTRSRRSITALMDIRPDKANLKTEDGIRVIAAEEIKADDIIIIKAGEKVPVDGVILEGSSSMDTRALTGESIPRDAAPGSTVLSGFINGQGLLQVRVTKEFSESTASKIIEMVQNASSKKAKTENFITKFAGYYTPAVVGIAAALAVIPPFLLSMGSFSEWLYRALVFLVISCPCALVISIPLGFFGGIGAASTNGILVKGSNYLEALNQVDTVIFDKTGTLTSGIFKVTEVITENNFTEAEVLRFAAYAEHHSTHPIAVSIRNRFLEGSKVHPEHGASLEIEESLITELEEKAGYGIRAVIEGKTVLAGNLRLMASEGVVAEAENEAGTIVYLAVDGTYAGAVIISDEEKPDSRNAVAGLREIGIKKIAMLTGDSKAIGEKVGTALKLDEVYAELLPQQKVMVMETILEQKNTASASRGKVVFVGDGINDAPVLARADIGIAMGGAGSDAAIEAADIVIMNDEPSKLITAIRIARKTRTIVWQNIIGALGVKGIVLILGALGFATMWEAVFADVGVALLAVLNSVRAGRID